MKRFFIPLLTVAVVVTIVFTGCAAPAPSPEPAPSVGWGPMAGVAVKPDGTPYNLPWVSEGIDADWTVVQAGVANSMVRRAGGISESYDPKRNVEQQVEIFKALILQKPDAIMVHAAEGAALVPVVEEATAAGIPVFYNDTEIPSDAPVCWSDHDQVDVGWNAGMLLVEEAEKTGKEINAYLIWGAIGMEQTERRSRGFKEACATSPLITVVDSPECGWISDRAMSAVADYFAAHPEANAVYEHCCMSPGIVEGLRQIGRLYPAGDPKHVYVVAGCAEAPPLQLIRDGYVDGLTDVDAWGLIDPNVKSTLLSVCCGLAVPKKIDVPVAFYTIENVDTPRWGAPLVWGDMVREYPDFDDWPLLDSGLIVTPTVDMKQPGY